MGQPGACVHAQIRTSDLSCLADCGGIGRRFERIASRSSAGPGLVSTALETWSVAAPCRDGLVSTAADDEGNATGAVTRTTANNNAVG